MSPMHEVRLLAEKDIDFGSAKGEYTLSNLEFIYAWHELAAAYGDFAVGKNKQQFSRQFTWWDGLISHLQAEIATAKAEWAVDTDKKWHFVPLEDYVAHWQRQLDAALSVRKHLDKKIGVLYGRV